jgi:hypothetical protein
VFRDQLEIPAITEWSSRVLSGSIAGRGPGESRFWAIFYENRAIGGLSYYVLFFPIVMIVLVIVIVICAICIPVKPSDNPPNRRILQPPSDPDFSVRENGPVRRRSIGE